VTLLYNKFPLGSLNSLLVPAIESHHPQRLTPELGRWAWAAATELGSRFAGPVLGYNSLGAHASVNHLHLQLLFEPHGLPIALPCWQHALGGGSERYPLPVAVLSSADELGAWLAESLALEAAHNLLLMPGRAYGIRRRRQDRIPSAPWTSGLAFLELAGVMLLMRDEDYRRLAEAPIEQHLRELAPG
jgi:hypothetical protein